MLGHNVIQLTLKRYCHNRIITNQQPGVELEQKYVNSIKQIKIGIIHSKLSFCNPISFRSLHTFMVILVIVLFESRMID